MNRVKLTTKRALAMVELLEKIDDDAREAREAVYREARDYIGGHGNESVLKDILKARGSAREEQWNADAMLKSFDVEDEK